MQIQKKKFYLKLFTRQKLHKKHFGYTLAGSKFKIKDVRGVREVDVPTGYSFSNEERTSHEVLNIGSETAVFLIIEPK